MGKSKKTEEVTPWKPAQPYILNSLAAVDNTFRENQPFLQQAATDFYGAYSNSAPGAEQGIAAAQNRVNRTLAGEFAGQNPGRAAYEAAMRAPMQTNNYLSAAGPNAALPGMAQVASGGFVGTGVGADAMRAQLANPAAPTNFAGAVGGFNAGTNAMQGMLNPTAAPDFMSALGGNNAGLSALQGQLGSTRPQDFMGALGGPNAGQNWAQAQLGPARAGQDFQSLVRSGSGGLGQFTSGNFVGGGPGMDYMGNVVANGRAATDFSAGTNRFTGALGRLGNGSFTGTGEGADFFRNVISGQYLEGNPYLQGQIDAATGDAANRVNAMFSSAGRYGSSAHQGTLAREAGRLSNEARFNNFQMERDRQMAASQQLDALTRADRGLQLQALQAAGGLQAQQNELGLRAQGMGADDRARIAQERLTAAQAMDQGRRADRGLQLNAIGMGLDNTARNNGLRLQAAQLTEQQRAAMADEQFRAAGLVDQGSRADAGLRLQAMGMGADNQFRTASAIDSAFSRDAGQRMQAMGLNEQARGARVDEQFRAATGLDNAFGRDQAARLQAMGMDEQARAGRFDEQFRLGSTLDQSLARDRGLQLQALGQFGDMSFRDQQQRLAAMGADDQARMQALQMQLAAAEAADRNFYLDQARMDQGIGMAQDLRAGNLGLLGNAAQLPWLGVQAQAGGVTGLSSPYSTRTTTTTPSLGATLGGIAGGVISAAGAAGGFGKIFPSEPGLKKNVREIGQRPDGLKLYEFEYKDGLGLPKGKQQGVMADEVQEKRPDALGPTVAGARTVDYGQLDAPFKVPAQADPMQADFGSVPTVRKPNFGQRLDTAFGNMVSGDMSRPGAGLSQLGAALMAGATDTGFEGIGKALLGAQLANREQANLDRKMLREEQEAAAIADYRRSLGMKAIADMTKQPDLPADVRTAEWYRSASSDQRRAYDATRPIVTNGVGSTVVPRESFLGAGGGMGIQPGTVEDGFVFLGGDPSDQASWQPLNNTRRR